jgi:predicted nucleic acid-binding protein
MCPRRRSEVVVSGDTDLLQLGTFRGVPLMTVAAFLSRFSSEKA